MPFSDRLKKMKLPTLVYRRTRGDMIKIYKEIEAIIKAINPVYFMSSILRFLNNDVQRTFESSFFTHRVVKLWNELPNNVVESKNLISFERNPDAY